MTRKLTYVLLGCIIVGSIVGWPQLPDRVPVRFGADGTVIRWEERSIVRWFLLPLLACLIAFPALWLARVLPRRPHLANVPDKERYLALAHERRLPVIERIRDMLHGIVAQALTLLAFVQLAIYRTAHGHDSQGLMVAVVVLSIIIVPVTLFLWLPGIRHEIDRQWRSQHGGSGPGV